ncbi:MAG: hypothetical protein P1P84_23205 [Deferrisomatales bacterium]|nr:hypothetical protein [Deferrisomatales bacterium]
MAGKILAGVFWAVGALLQAYALSTGGWAWVVPGAAALAGLLVGLDLAAHRPLVAIDLALVRTLLHVLSAATVAATCMYWLGMLLLTRGG